MRYKILIIDDDKELLKMLRKYFEIKGYEVIRAENGTEGLNKMKLRPDIILLDINMPKIDGIEVCRRIRDKVTCPVLFLTARVEEQDIVNGLSSGGDDYILKPFSLQELDARITAHLKREERRKNRTEYYFQGDLSIDYTAKTVQIHEAYLELTKFEYAIIKKKGGGIMWSILKREVRNYIKSPLFWVGIAVVAFMVFQNVSPYLNIHYLTEGEEIVNNYPETFRDGDVYEGYVPTDEALRREVWGEQIQETLISEFQMNSAEAQSVINEMNEMDIMTACEYLERYSFYNAYGVFADTAYHKGTREEINSYIAEKLENRTFSYYFSRKFADFAGLFMGFFATVILSVLFMQDTRKNTYELLHTKPVSVENYLLGKAGGGFAVCLMILAVLNLIFWMLCHILTKNSGFEVRISDFLLATCFYILPNMLMIVSVYSLISLLFKSPLPAVPLLFLYMVYSNMGSRNANGVYGYYGRPLAIMVRFPGTFFDTAPPPMVLLNQSFLILASAGILLISMQIWKRRRVY